MTDHNTNHAEEQAAIREAQEHACAEYLFASFNWSKRTAEVVEILNGETPNRLDGAIAAFMMMDSLTLRLMLESAAKAICERSAQKLIKAHGDSWQEFYERDEFEW